MIFKKFRFWRGNDETGDGPDVAGKYSTTLRYARYFAPIHDECVFSIAIKYSGRAADSCHVTARYREDSKHAYQAQRVAQVGTSATSTGRAEYRQPTTCKP